MKCYILSEPITAGFKVRTNDDRPFVTIGATAPGAENHKLQLLLSDEFVTMLSDATLGGQLSHESTRIMACGLEQRSEFWLVPESKDNSQDALVLVAWSFWVDKDDLALKLDFVYAAGAKPFIDQCWNYRKDGTLHTIRRALICMSPGSSFRIEMESTTQLGAYKRWIGSIPSGPQRTSQTVTYSAAGELTLSEEC